MALPKTKRLTLNRETAGHLNRKEKTVKTALFFVRFHVKDSGESRFAVVIGKAFSKKAVVRNSIRRLIHQAILTALPRTVTVRGLPKQIKVDMIIYPRKGIIEKDSKVINKEIENLLSKI